MSYLLNATGEYLSGANPWAGGAFSISMWIRRPSGVTTNKRMLTLLANGGDQATTTPRVTLSTTTGPTATASYVASSGTSTDAVTTATYSADTWFNVIVVFTGSGSSLTSVLTYLDGTPDPPATSATRDMSGTMDKIYIGSIAAGDFSNAYIAEVAFWDKELSAQEIADLQTYYPSGVAVKNSSTANLKAYWPLLSDAAADDTYGGATYDLTVAGTAATDAEHPSLTPFGASAVKGRSLLLGVG